MTNSQLNIKQERSSNLELYRIIVMLLIVAHHSIVNSGVMELMAADPLSLKSSFAYLFGMWGKTGINCFVLISGYFMCESRLTLRRYLKLTFEVIFYGCVVYLFLVAIGETSFSIKQFALSFIPIKNADSFTGAFLLFYLFVPFLNVFVHSITQQQHCWLIGLSVLLFSLMPYLPFFHVSISYVFWFMVLFIIASYIRMYQDKIYKSGSASFWGWMSVLSILIAQLSVFANLLLRPGKSAYIFVSDSNAIMALIVSVCTFMFFRNLKIRNSKIINVIAATTFGVFLLHTRGSIMRAWLWGDVANVRNLFMNDDFMWKISLAIPTIFIVCCMIDLVRVNIIEKPLFAVLDKYCGKLNFWK